MRGPSQSVSNPEEEEQIPEAHLGSYEDAKILEDEGPDLAAVWELVCSSLARNLSDRDQARDTKGAAQFALESH